MKRAVGLRWKLSLFVALFAAAAVQANGTAELEDAAARAQYAFFTNDPRALQDVLRMVAELELDGRFAASRTYLLSHGHWKLAQLHSQRGHTSTTLAAAGSSARSCVEYAKAAIQQDARMAEAHALQAICEDKPNTFVALSSLERGSCERHRALRTALSLAPQNPRVQLIEAMCMRPLGPAQEVERWRGIVASFDAAPRPQSGVVDWGHAEALTLLAEAQLRSGARVAARDAAEKALVIAPDYESARAVLQAISSQSN